MRISAISDVHVKRPNDEAYRLLSAFLINPLVQDSDYIVLLGDIFDLMCGPHEAYLKDYSDLFDKMNDLVKKGKKVLYYEGNHDVHLAKLFKKLWPAGEIVPTQKPGVHSIEGKTYYFSHGDEHEVDNLAYHRYMNFIRSAPLRFTANHIMPYAVLDYIGKKASQKSRKKGSYRFDEERERAKFRDGVQKTTHGKFDFVLGGHSHVKEEFILPGTNSTYLNNGYALNSKTFIMIDNHHVSFPELLPLAEVAN